MMLKYAVLISLLVVMGESQRPPYAGTANRYPMVNPRFAEEQANAAAAAAAATTPDVDNRVGEESTTWTGAANDVAAQAPTAGPTPDDLPVLALGQRDFVNRVATWPEDKRPFWYTNRDHIAAHLNPAQQAATVRPVVAPRSFFAGK